MAKKLTDLTGDGKVTQADVLKGRGAFKVGGMMKKGYKKGGSVCSKCGTSGCSCNAQKYAYGGMVHGKKRK